MSKLRVLSFGVSVDGYGAGPHQSVDHPLGVGGPAILEWLVETRTGRRVMGQGGGTGGMDDEFAAKGFGDIGAWIIGRNMFGPVRGPWHDDSWKGWWGEDPPFHTPVFVLTRYTRGSFAMRGGTTFHFVTDGIHRALEQARESADGKDIRLGGGAATIRQYLLARLVDEMHLAFSPTLLGSGESLLANIDLPALGYHVHAHTATPKCMHIEIVRQ
jgi:dihydrofolate reductase